MGYERVEEFISSCDGNEIKELVSQLRGIGVISKRWFWTNSNPLDMEWGENLKKLAFIRHKLTKEEEDIINNMARKY